MLEQKQTGAQETRTLMQINADKEKEDKLAAKGKRKADAAAGGDDGGEALKKKKAAGAASAAAGGDKVLAGNGVTEADVEEYRRNREMRFDDPLAQVKTDELLPL